MRNNEPLAPSELNSGVQLEDALQVAERLLNQAERAAERRRAARSLEAGVFGFSVLAVASIAIADRLVYWRLTTIVVVGVLVGYFVAIVIRNVQEVPLRKRIDRDARAAVDIVEIARELLPIVARQEGWSDLQTELFRSRLSRFPIGPGGVDA
jgi:hypothetical protein